MIQRNVLPDVMLQPQRYAPLHIRVAPIDARPDAVRGILTGVGLALVLWTSLLGSAWAMFF